MNHDELVGLLGKSLEFEFYMSIKGQSWADFFLFFSCNWWAIEWSFCLRVLSVDADGTFLLFLIYFIYWYGNKFKSSLTGLDFPIFVSPSYASSLSLSIYIYTREYFLRNYINTFSIHFIFKFTIKFITSILIFKN
jgi:hypothetical protein